MSFYKEMWPDDVFTPEQAWVERNTNPHYDPDWFRLLRTIEDPAQRLQFIRNRDTEITWMIAEIIDPGCRKRLGFS